MDSPDPCLLLPQIFVEDLRDAATREEPDTIAVIVLAGTPERGLAISVSSKESAEETTRLLLAALLDEAAHEVVVALDAQAEQEDS